MVSDAGTLLSGLATAFEFANLIFCLVGVLLGMASGMLPGIGPTAMLSIILPLTLSLQPISSVILLAGLYNGAQQGAAIAAILASSYETIATGGPTTDGRMMAWQGQAGRAIAISVISAVAAATFGLVVMSILGPLLASFGSGFGPADYFAAIVLTLVVALLVSRGPVLNALAMICLGLLLGLVGMDITTGVARLTFGQAALLDGIGILTVAIGTFAIGETIAIIERDDRRGVVIKQIQSILPMKGDLRRMAPAIFRGSILGSLFGLIPGGGPALSSYGAYEIERRIPQHGNKIGQGAVEEVAVPAAANKAGLQTSFITLLTLGIPSNAPMAIMLAALMTFGIQPGPLLVSTQPQLFWGLIASIWLGSVLLLFVGIAMIRGLARIIEVPYGLLYPAILGFCTISVYSMTYSTFDIYVMCVFGFLGYFFKKIECNPVPMLLGFIVSPLFEEQFRRTLMISNGDLLVFFRSSVTAKR